MGTFLIKNFPSSIREFMYFAYLNPVPAFHNNKPSANTVEKYIFFFFSIYEYRNGHALWRNFDYIRFFRNVENPSKWNEEDVRARPCICTRTHGIIHVFAKVRISRWNSRLIKRRIRFSWNMIPSLIGFLNCNIRPAN